MMDCKTALVEAKGDVDLAIEILRKKGISKAVKKAERTASDGRIIANVNSHNGALVEINCETDFVSRNDEFIQFTNQITRHVLENQLTTLETVLDSKWDGKKVSDKFFDLVGKLGENIQLKRMALLSSPKGYITSYVHPGDRLGVLVDIELENSTVVTDDLFKQFAKDIAMQVAASTPMVVVREEVARDVIDKEMEIYREQIRNEKKPETIIEKISLGKLEKFYQDTVLMEQAFIKDPSKTIKELVGETSKNLGQKILIKRFVRFRLGESN
jgi:elongation factor Ts